MLGHGPRTQSLRSGQNHTRDPRKHQGGGHIQAMVLRVGGAGKKQPFAPFGQCEATHDQDHGQHLNHLLIGLHVSALFQRVKKRKAQLIKRP